MQDLHPTVADVTERVRARSRASRDAYLTRTRAAAVRGPRRSALSCSNLAHGFAACNLHDKNALKGDQQANVAIVSAYNDMLSAHQPLAAYPPIIQEAARAAGAVAQFAGGVPAMCDGVTQGQAGMELSLFSRDVIALSTAIALSHDMFDGGICLGVCDKIVPGLLIGALGFGHLPFAFLPAGPMPSGLPNKEKARIRQLYAEGKIDRATLLEAESQSYHSPGTCTFYGTANSNQMFMEIMGLHLPGASFENPGTPLREALVRATARRVAVLAGRATARRDGTDVDADTAPLAEIIDERALINAVVGLLATGGSTNHTIHLIAIGRAAGIRLDWDDFDALSGVVPLLTRVYPNGSADVNHFHAAGGLAYLIGQLIDGGLLHRDVRTIADGLVAPDVRGLDAYRYVPQLGDDGALAWVDGPTASGDADIVRPVDEPFQTTGGLQRVVGNLGRAVVKTSAVDPEQRAIEAPAMIFERQEDLIRAFQAGEMNRDLVAVVRGQGPRANGMPELHKLMPPLRVLQDRGHRVALVTDGRLSGASGRVSAAIHVTPEAFGDGPLARLREGDVVRLDPAAGVLEARVDAQEWAARTPASIDREAFRSGLGRELFSTFRHASTGAEMGAMTFGGFVAHDRDDVPVEIDASSRTPEGFYARA
ncbi:MAG: phosphogluconate dehydratase [Acidobacteriota bacterium]